MHVLCVKSYKSVSSNVLSFLDIQLDFRRHFHLDTLLSKHFHTDNINI